MIQNLPRDPSLKDLSCLVDESAMIERIAANLQQDAGVEIVGCRPVYIRYKPKTSCLVQYEVTISDSTNTVVRLIAHIKTFNDDRAGRRWQSRKLGNLIDRDARLKPNLPFGRAAYVPELDGLLQFFPIDYDLPFLVKASSAPAMNRLLRKQVSSSGISVASTPELIRYKPGRKALFRYELVDDSVVYGKVHLDSRGERIAVGTRALVDAGFPTPPVVLALPDQSFIAHAEFSGTQLASMRAEANYEQLMEPLADVLHRFHSTEVPAGLVHTLSDEGERICETARMLATIHPAIGRRVNQLGEEIVDRLDSVDCVIATNHGDFYDDQAIVSEEGMSIIDLDEMRMAHPLLDIGNMLAHMRSDPHHPEKMADARDAFLASMQKRVSYSDRDVSLFESIGLLKLAPGPFRRLENDWRDGIERIVEMAEESLGASQGEGRPVPWRPNPQVIEDEALPQLKRLQDPEVMTSMLGHDVAEVEVIRHKPGRRAILRYELVDGQPLFGKTFASKRGSRVFGITQNITRARAFGPSVVLPEPVMFLADTRLLVQRAVPGTSVEPALLSGDVTLVEQIADALYAFHTSGIDLGREHNLEKELSPLRMRARQVGEHAPDLASYASKCLSDVFANRPETGAWRRLPVHRDFYHDQVLTNGETLAVLDLDDASMSDPMVDVANFAAHLILLGLQRGTDLDGLRDAFVTRYRSLDVTFRNDLYRYLVSSTLLRLAGIHVSRANGQHIAAALLEMSREMVRTQKRL